MEILETNLVQHLAENLNISEGVAENIVASLTQFVQQQLNQEGEVHLPGIGTLTYQPGTVPKLRALGGQHPKAHSRKSSMTIKPDVQLIAGLEECSKLSEPS